ncbi:hypothetical protein CRG98_035044, partial [Punica granatum]
MGQERSSMTDMPFPGAISPPRCSSRTVPGPFVQIIFGKKIFPRARSFLRVGPKAYFEPWASSGSPIRFIGPVSGLLLGRILRFLWGSLAEYRVRFRAARRMEASGGNSDSYRGSATGIGSSGTSNFRRYGILSASNIIQAPISTLLEYSGLLRTRPNHPEVEPLFSGSATSGVVHSRVEDTSLSGGDGEVSIRIIGAGEQEHHRDGAGLVVGGHQQVREPSSQDEVSVRPVAGGDGQGDIRSGVDEGAPTASAAGANDSEVGEGNGRDSTYQRYDIQQAARWIEQ